MISLLFQFLNDDIIAILNFNDDIIGILILNNDTIAILNFNDINSRSHDDLNLILDVIILYN